MVHKSNCCRTWRVQEVHLVVKMALEIHVSDMGSQTLQNTSYIIRSILVHFLVKQKKKCPNFKDKVFNAIKYKIMLKYVSELPTF